MTKTNTCVPLGSVLMVWLLLAASALVAGCSQAETPIADAPSDGIEALPPAQIQRALEQLTSSNARAQNSGLEFVEQFPSLAETHRELIQKLSENGATAAVKKKASELLEPSE